MSSVDLSDYDLEPSAISQFAIDHIENAYEQCIHESKTHVYRYACRWRIKSPLEAAFSGCWEVYSMVRMGGFSLYPQFPVDVHGSKYLLDFVVIPSNTFPFGPSHTPPIKVAVELDGHAFHERTRAQVQRRDQRDRELSGAGWRVLHFSWGEFNNGPFECFYVAHRAANQALSASRRSE